MAFTPQVPDSRELPDHLPLYLEYLAQLPKSAKVVVGFHRISRRFWRCSARLQQRDSRYAVLFDSLLKLANNAIDSSGPRTANEARDDTPQALDAVWEEEQVKFFADLRRVGNLHHQRRFASPRRNTNITTWRMAPRALLNMFF